MRSHRARGAPPSALRTFVLLFGFSMLLLLSREWDPLRATSSFGTTLLVPVQRVLSDTGSGINRFFQAISEIERLRATNAQLRGENDRLTLENVQLREELVARVQNERLDALARTLPYETVGAGIIARDPSRVVRTIAIDQGTDAGVAVGHVVLAEQGVVGRVIEVGANYAKVLLVTDNGSSVAGLAQESRATGIVHGQFGDALVMEWILQSETIAVGDVVLTAGLGVGDEIRSRFPKGLVLGRVVEVSRAENAAYQRAVLQPAVDLRRLERVLVVKIAP